MMRTTLSIFMLVMSATPVAAWGQERDYCPARPGLGTPACTTPPGRVSVETGISDWTRDATPDARSDMFVFGDTLVRIGVSDTVEAQVGWTPFGRVRARDTATGTVTTSRGVGDLYVGFSANLANPDGSGFSVAIQPFATLPVGGQTLGAGDWGAGIVLPMSYDLDDRINLQFTGEVDAAVDGDRSGRHLAYSGTAGIGYALSDTLGATVEVQGARDDDPAGRSTQWLGAVSLGWMRSERLQLDVGANVGLNRDAPDAQVYFGIARRF